MIQLRRVRSFSPTGLGEKKFDKPVDDNIFVESIAVLFQTFETLVEKISPSERWNIYYTLGETNADEKRDWHAQEVIPFDIDNIVDELNKSPSRGWQLILDDRDREMIRRLTEALPEPDAVVSVT